ncbi:hypothetical protein HDU76_003678, partial [Blyttiomyces sp. JEL0837]
LSHNDAVVERLTDVSGYTGTHKSRFNADGTGRGMEGRDSVSKTDRLDKLVNRDDKKRVQILTASEERLGHGDTLDNDTITDLIANSPKKPIAGRRADTPNTMNISDVVGSQSSLASSAYNKGSLTSLSEKKPSVFDRLTDSSGYTGSHKHRFNADGSGRGLAGRDTIAKSTKGQGTYRGGDVRDLSQILRN